MTRKQKKQLQQGLFAVVLVLVLVAVLFPDSFLSRWFGTKPTATVPLEDGAALTVHYLDVGQADAILVVCDDQTMLIDGGNRGDAADLVAYFDALGIEDLDYVVCTHGHEDHCGGLAGVMASCYVHTLFTPVTNYDSMTFQNMMQAAEEQEMELTVPEAGDHFTLGSAAVTFLGPVKSYGETNNTSLVMRLTFGETSFLFTGDAEMQSETDILDSGAEVSADVLKVGHHGSSTSTSYRWLREVMPTYAVISVGADNSYGHPEDAVLSRLEDAEVTVYRTDEQGTVICTSDGKTVSFQTER